MPLLAGNAERQSAEEDVGRPDSLSSLLPRFFHQRHDAATTGTVITRRRQTAEGLQADAVRQLRTVASGTAR